MDSGPITAIEPSPLRTVLITFRPELMHQCAYLATPEVVRQIASDYAGETETGGVYEVFAAPGEPRTLALRFDDVLYIG